MSTLNVQNITVTGTGTFLAYTTASSQAITLDAEL